MKILLIMVCTILSFNLQASDAVTAFEAKNYKQAKLLFENYGNKGEANYYLGRIALDENNLDEAEEYLEKAVELNADSAEYHYMFGLVNFRQIAKSSFLFMAGYASTGKKHFKKAIEINPKHTQAILGMISFYTNAPGIGGGSFKEAHKIADELIKFKPMLGKLAKIDIYREEEEIDKELELVEQVAKDYPESPKALVKVGFTYQNVKNYKSAMMYFKKAVEIKDEKDINSSQSALYQIGRTAVFSQQFTQQGVEALEEYIQLDLDSELPSIEWATYRLAELYLSQGEQEKAMQRVNLLIKNTADTNLRDESEDLLEKVRN